MSCLSVKKELRDRPWDKWRFREDPWSSVPLISVRGLRILRPLCLPCVSVEVEWKDRPRDRWRLREDPWSLSVLVPAAQDVGSPPLSFSCR